MRPRAATTAAADTAALELRSRVQQAVERVKAQEARGKTSAKVGGTRFRSDGAAAGRFDGSTVPLQHGVAGAGVKRLAGG